MKDSSDVDFTDGSALSCSSDSAVVLPEGCPVTDGTSSGGSDGVSGVGILAPGLYSVML